MLMQLTLVTAAAAVGILAGGGSVMTGAYFAVDDYMTTREVAYTNQRERLKNKWFSLDRDKTRRTLRQGEWDQWCDLGKRYGYINNCGRRPGGERQPRQPRRRR